MIKQSPQLLFYNNVKDQNVPEWIGCVLLELADFEADLELCFPLEGADARGPSLRTTGASCVSFRAKDGVFESFLEGPLPARTLRAFSSACSSNSISSLSLAEAPASDARKHDLSLLSFPMQ